MSNMYHATIRQTGNGFIVWNNYDGEWIAKDMKTALGHIEKTHQAYTGSKKSR